MTKEVALIDLRRPQELDTEWVAAKDPRNECRCIWPNRLREIEILGKKNHDREPLSHSVIGKVYKTLSERMKEQMARAILANRPPIEVSFPPEEIYTPEQIKFFQHHRKQYFALMGYYAVVKYITGLQLDMARKIAARSWDRYERFEYNRK